MAEMLPEERLAQNSDLIIQSIIKSDEESIKNRQYIFSQFKPEIFKNENFIIYSILYNFKDKMLTPDAEFISLYLLRNTKLITDNQADLNIAEYKDLADNEVEAYTSAVLKKYTRLLQLPNADNLNLISEKFKEDYKAIELATAYDDAKYVLYDGKQIGRRSYQGYEDSISVVKRTTAKIEGLLDKTVGAGFVDASDYLVDEDEDTKPVKISDFDLVTELNEYLGGIYTSIFYNVMAPTKGGKSKFCARTQHTAMVKYGRNVTVWPHEGGPKAWIAQLRAIHYEWFYIRNQGRTDLPRLSQKDILWGTYPSEEVKQLEMLSRQDLFTNPSYGKANLIDRPFKVETFIDEIETAVQLNNSSLVIIDYLQLIEWDSYTLSKNQAIGKAYQLALAYCKKRNIAIISPSQFKQEFMNEMAKSKDGQGHEFRTAGGESSEIIRTPDINIALYASIDDLQRKEMTIKSIPSRLAEPHPDIKIYADLCSCVFASKAKKGGTT